MRSCGERLSKERDEGRRGVCRWDWMDGVGVLLYLTSAGSMARAVEKRTG